MVYIFKKKKKKKNKKNSHILNVHFIVTVNVERILEWQALKFLMAYDLANLGSSLYCTKSFFSFFVTMPL